MLSLHWTHFREKSCSSENARFRADSVTDICNERSTEINSTNVNTELACNRTVGEWFKSELSATETVNFSALAGAGCEVSRMLLNVTLHAQIITH